MGTIYHNPLVVVGLYSDPVWKPIDLNPAYSEIDTAITYIKNVMVHCDGDIIYSKVSGIMSWADPIRILFNRADGQAIENIINAGSKQIFDDWFYYADLNETDGTILTIGILPRVYNWTSNFYQHNRLVLGYKNPLSDRLFSLWLDINPDKLVQEV